MKKKIYKSVEIRIAVFAIVGLFLLVWGIHFLKGIDIFKSQCSYYVVFDNAAGLLPSNAVTVNGMGIGKVDNVRLMPENSNKIVVTMSVDKHLKIPANSIARIVSSNPLSSPQIEIVFGTEAQYLQQGDTMQAEAAAAGLFNELGEMMTRVKSILISVDTSVNLLQKTLQSGALNDVEIALKRLRAATNKIDNLLAENSPKVNTIISDVQTFTNTLHKNDDKINEMIGNFNTISEELAAAELKKTVNNAANAIGELDSLLYKINQGQGTLGQLVVNDSLYNSMQNSLLSLERLLGDVQKNPKKYINITVFERKTKGK